ncbi:hypothetical protein C8F01DRAFT_1082651 [Mycena amicta]|nr:hypothetical protein C8F01DRAFT_1082651 [Mycena amicta]
MVVVNPQKPRIPKANRKNLRLWAEGARETILKPYLADYGAALDRGTVAEHAILRLILREYFGRVHWSTQDDQEPVLKDWNGSASMEVEALTPEMQQAKEERIKILSDRIRRWFRYRIQRRNRFRRTWARNPDNDPFARFVLELSGLSKVKKRRQPWQQFMREQYPMILPIIQRRWAESQLADPELRGKKPGAGFRGQVTRALFANLPQSHQTDYKARAKEEADLAKQEYENALQQPPATTPQARHEALARLVNFIGPILQEIFNVTGCHSTVLIGGPQPEFGGDISIQHICFGRNLTPSAQHWAQWQPERFKKDVLGFYLEYLQTAYMPTRRVGSDKPRHHRCFVTKLKMSPRLQGAVNNYGFQLLVACRYDRGRE